MSKTENWLKLINPDYLNRGFFNIKPGLSRIKTILSSMNIKKDKPIFQIVGTNGKGSTTYIISGLLGNLGYSVGAFMSPHEISPTERILINNRQIKADQLNEIISVVNDAEISTGIVLSYFELLTAAALYWFKINNVDLIILEAGMGGRWDASSALGQNVLVVTSIGIDHTDYLGKTAVKIAEEKIAAVSEGSKLIIAPQRPDVYRKLTTYAEKRTLPVVKYINRKLIKILESNLSGTSFLYKDMLIKTNLLGECQPINIITAIESVRLLYDLPNDIIRRTVGFLRIPSRLEIQKANNLTIIFDGGHNRDAIEGVCRFFKKIKKRITIIYSSMKDKNYQSNLCLLSTLSDSLLIVELPFERAEKAVNLLKAAKGIFKYSRIIDIAGLSELLKSKYDSDEIILITGSFYLTGLFKYVIKTVDDT